MLGALFGVLFGAVSVYVGLRAGLTVSASIPIAVLSISILRAFGRSTILENNIVQTTGSAGESAGGGRDLHYARADFPGLFAEHGILAHLFSGAARRKAGRAVHDSAAAAADREGARQPDVSRRHGVRRRAGGGRARRIVCRARVLGTRARRRLHVLHEHAGAVAGPAGISAEVAAGRVLSRCTITSEYLGVGYIIGPRVAGLFLRAA